MPPTAMRASHRRPGGAQERTQGFQERIHESYKLAAKGTATKSASSLTKSASASRNISGSYWGQIDQLEQQQFDLRRDAISRLEDFIYRHAS